jgi:hypothetical protein
MAAYGPQEVTRNTILDYDFSGGGQRLRQGTCCN